MAGGCRSTVVRSIVAASLVASFAVANVAAESAHAGARPAIVVDPAPGSTSRFVAVGPLRLADTRKASCGCTHVDDHTIHVAVAGQQGAPDPIVAAAVTVTVVNGPVAGFVTAYPSGTARPETSTVNMAASAVASNSAVVPVGSDGGIDLYADVTADIVVDVTGVFTTTTFATAGRFVPVAPRRLLDTRVSPGVRVLPAASVTVPLPDGVPADATAVAVNVTSLDEFAAGFVSGYAAGATPATTSFLNPDGTGGAKAAAVILPVSASGFTIATSAGGDLVVDLVGWFTGASAASSTDGLFVPLPPTRLLDTRASGPRLWPGGTREVVLPLGAVGAVVTNITLDRTDATGFVTAYPAGTPQPPSSSLNATGRDATIANFAISQPSTRGVAYFANAGSDLIVDRRTVHATPADPAARHACVRPATKRSSPPGMRC